MFLNDNEFLRLCMIFFYLSSYYNFWRNGYRRWFHKLLSNLEVAGSTLPVGEYTGILNTCTQLWLTESEQATLVD